MSNLPARALQHIWNPQSRLTGTGLHEGTFSGSFLGRQGVNPGCSGWRRELGISPISCWVGGSRSAAGLLSCGSPSSAIRAVPRVSLACPGLPSLEGNVFVYAALPDFLCFLALGHSFHASLSVFINTNFFLSLRSAGEFLSGFYVPARLCVNSQQCYQ